MFRQLSRQCVARSSLTKGFRSLSTDLQETFMKSPESYYAYSYPETSNTRFSSSPSNTPEFFFAFLLLKQEGFGSAYRSPQPPPPENVGKVRVPSRTGQMEIYPGQPNTLEVLKPGVVSLVDGKSTTRYFITDVATDEAIPLDYIDPAEVHKGLKESTQKLRSASTDLEKAEAQIGVDVLNSLNAALHELLQEEGKEYISSCSQVGYMGDSYMVNLTSSIKGVL
ncbi:hypothetical protein MKW92_006679 [Papaver armeniacum]|nr:hypothetical protein MKW92_006679 [Papaver armeniacum]